MSAKKKKTIYNTKYVTSYMDSDVFLESDEVNASEKEFILNCIYRQDLLNIFSLDDFVDTEINQKIAKLLKLLKHHNELHECMLIASQNLCGSEDEMSGLMVLFSFDYLYLTHPCICEYLMTNTIFKETIVQLKNGITTNTKQKISS
jgi:hypothetical protein